MALTYIKGNGRPMTLAYHTPAEWSAVMAGRLEAVGCSPEYVEREARAIAAATPAPTQPLPRGTWR